MLGHTDPPEERPTRPAADQGSRVLAGELVHLSSGKRRGDVLQLKLSQRGQLLIDALEYMVVDIPGLVQLCFFPGLHVLLQPVVRLCQLLPIRLHATELLCSSLGNLIFLYMMLAAAQYFLYAS